MGRCGSAVSTRPRSPSAETFEIRGPGLAGLGKLEEALEDFDEALRIRPEFPEAFRNRGMSKAQLDRTEDAMADFDIEVSQSSDTTEAYFNRRAARRAGGRSPRSPRSRRSGSCARPTTRSSSVPRRAPARAISFMGHMPHSGGSASAAAVADGRHWNVQPAPRPTPCFPAHWRTPTLPYRDPATARARSRERHRRRVPETRTLGWHCPETRAEV